MKLVKIFSLVIAAVFIIATLVFNFTKQAQPFSEDSTSAAMLQNGPYQVASLSDVLVDNYRSTQENGDAIAMDVRKFDTIIWYPVENGAVVKGQHPLVIYSHGFSSMKEEGAHVGPHLASHGYIVVGLALKGQFSHVIDATIKGLEVAVDDLQFSLQQLLKLPNVDGNQIALIGNAIESSFCVGLASRNKERWRKCRHY